MPVQICIAIFLAIAFGMMVQKNTSHQAGAGISHETHKQIIQTDHSNILVVTTINRPNRMFIISRPYITGSLKREGVANTAYYFFTATNIVNSKYNGRFNDPVK